MSTSAVFRSTGGDLVQLAPARPCLPLALRIAVETSESKSFERVRDERANLAACVAVQM